MMPEPSEVDYDPWSERMARPISRMDDQGEMESAILAAMDAAAEMKTVRLKVLLGRCL